MKHILFKKGMVFVLIAMMFLISSVVMGNTTVKKTENMVEESEWTIMIYLNGDNYGYSGAQNTLDKVKMVGSTDAVRFVVLIDGDSDGDTRLYYVEKNSLVELDWPTESDMGDGETLRQFLEKGMGEYPSKHYGLILFSDHGSGWQGVCWDITSGGSIITMPELASVLDEITESGTKKLGLIGIETCMTGMTEVAYQVRSFCDYMVISEECMLAGIWPYSGPFCDLRDNPYITPEELAICIVNHFTPEVDPVYGLKTTLSATNLSKLDELGDAINEISLLLKDDVNEFKDEISLALSNTRKYASIFNIDYYVDLYHFMELLTIDNEDVVYAKNKVMNVMNTTVIANAHVDGDNSGGLSIYFPSSKYDYNSSLWYEEIPVPYEEVMFALDTNWDDFLKTFLYSLFEIRLEKPTGGNLYIADREIAPILRGNPLIIGKITIETDALDEDGVDRVEFYVDDELKETIYDEPFEWTWNERAFGTHEIQVTAYDNDGDEAEDKIDVIIFNL